MRSCAGAYLSALATGLATVGDDVRVLLRRAIAAMGELAADSSVS
jgi:hypothetical protein